MKNQNITFQQFLERIKTIDVGELLEKAKTIKVEDIKSIKLSDLKEITKSDYFFPSIGIIFAALTSILFLIPSIESLKEKTNSIDILINNAGILIPGLKHKIDAVETDDESILKTFNINTVGVLRVCKAVLPLMRPTSRIINISSGMGQMEGMATGSIAYRLSKSALNALTIVLSQELSSKDIKVNAICPGWVKTDMGGYEATLTVKESVESIKKFALSDDFPNGKFLRHGEILPW